MATLAESKLHIAGTGHVLYAPVGTEYPNLDQFKFGDESTYGEFVWLGDVSSENMIEFETDGGDVSYKRTFDRKQVRSVREDQTTTGTINSVNIGRETFDVAFGGGEYVESTKSYKVKSNGFARELALLVVTEDGQDIAGLGLPSTTVQGSMPVWDVEEFTEIPMSVAVQSDVDQTIFEIFEPRPYAAASGGGGGA